MAEEPEGEEEENYVRDYRCCDSFLLSSYLCLPEGGRDLLTNCVIAMSAGCSMVLKFQR